MVFKLYKNLSRNSYLNLLVIFFWNH